MPAHRKSRPQTEEDLKEAVTVECLARLEQAFPADAYDPSPLLLFEGDIRETWHGWTSEICRGLYMRPLGDAQEDRQFRRLYETYRKIRDHLEELQRTCEGLDRSETRGRASDLADAIQKDLFPLDRFARLFSEEAKERWDFYEQWQRGGTRRQAFIEYTDHPIIAEPWLFRDAWGFGREASNPELAWVALAAGDFPVVNVGEDTPADVIDRMTSTMRGERQRLWLKRTGGRYAGPNKPHKVGQ